MTLTSDLVHALDPSARMVQMLNAQCLVQALYVAADLGIADLLAHEPRTLQELAGTTGADAPSLGRLLRFLASEDIFSENEGGSWELTPLGATLRSDVSDSVRDLALYMAAPEVWATWGNLRQSVMSGQPAFEQAYRMPFLGYLALHPRIGTPFNHWMRRGSAQDDAALLANYDFTGSRRIVDVGGGHGATLAAILPWYPSLTAVLVDLPIVVSNAEIPPALAGRVKTVSVDVRDSVPGGADCYLIKSVLMMQQNDDAVRVLTNCRKGMAEGGKVVVVDMVLPPGNQPSPATGADLFMLAFLHGRVRGEDDFVALFRAAGLRMTRIIPMPATPLGLCIIEGKAK